MHYNREKIAIIGGGSIGISFLIQLIDRVIAEKITDKVEILLFEPQAVVGPGYAYQADFECNLLNTRADTMSAKYQEKNHFIKWLQDNRLDWQSDYPNVTLEPNAYLPRSLFGRYLNSIYEESLRRMEQHQIPFYLIQDKVTDIIKIDSTKSCLDTEKIGGVIVNHIAICIGNLPSNKFKALHDKPGYFNSPYPCRAVTQSIPKTASVSIIGTSLSAIDMVLSLKEAGHTGNITCISRNGRLPSVRGSLNKSYSLKVITKERIDTLMHENKGILRLQDVIGLFLEEYEHLTGQKCNVDEILNLGVGMHDYISTEVRLACSKERAWQSIIYATNLIIDYIWHRLSLEDKHTFNQFFRSMWLAYRVSFPVANAVKINEYLRTNQLYTFGGIEHISYDTDKKLFSTNIHNKRTGLRSIIQSDYVVNATCFALDVQNCQIPLIQNLLSRRVAIAHEFGGLVVDYDTGTLEDAHGKLDERITVLGSLTTGTYLWTNAMDVNARLAFHQVSQLTRKLKVENTVDLRVNSEQLLSDNQHTDYGIMNDLNQRQVAAAC